MTPNIESDGTGTAHYELKLIILILLSSNKDRFTFVEHPVISREQPRGGAGRLGRSGKSGKAGRSGRSGR